MQRYNFFRKFLLTNFLLIKNHELFEKKMILLQKIFYEENIAYHCFYSTHNKSARSSI